MGVKGLWKHLGPAGRKINIQDLEGKIIAIDASIWAIQFLSIMQYFQNPDQAEDLQQSLTEFRVVDGFLRRILKLLFFGIKPVFVFDGQTPALKKKTLQLRRQTRNFGSDDQINLQKAAEKLLNKVLTEQLRPTTSIENKDDVEETKNNHQEKQSKPQMMLNDFLEMKECSELSSEINIDYLSDECQQITQLL